MAMACLRLVTFLPLRPLRNLPCFISCISSFTYSCAFGPYLRPLELLLELRFFELEPVLRELDRFVLLFLRELLFLELLLRELLFFFVAMCSSLDGTAETPCPYLRRAGCAAGWRDEAG